MINEFRAALKTYLGTDYYWLEAPETAVYPYRVGSFNGSFDDEVSEVFAFELDYWNDGKSSSDLYTLIKSDCGDGNPYNPTGLNHKRFNLTTGTAFIAKDNQIEVEDPDKNIRHIRVSYTVRMYTGG